MATQEQRRAETREKLLKAFRKSFLKQGFDATTTQSVLADAGLSKGALYHHFQSKTEIMEEIYRNESMAAIDSALANTKAQATCVDRLRETCVTWIRQVESKDVSRILFELGPAALGRKRAKEIEDQYSLHHFEQLLEQAAADGEIAIGDPKLIAALLNALVAESVVYKLRTAKDPVPDLKLAIDAVLESCRAKDRQAV